MFSPCGIHAFAEPVDVCPRCARLDTVQRLDVHRARSKPGGLPERTGRRGRPARTFELDGERRTLRQWLATHPRAAPGLTVQHVLARLALGDAWPLERALTEPVERRREKR